MNTRIMSLAAALMTFGAGTALAQGPEITPKPEVKDEPSGDRSSAKNDKTESIDRRWHFEGTISSVNPGNREVTVNADSVPGGGLTTLPYVVPESIPFETFKKGDHVNGEIVVRENRTFVESLKVGPAPKDADEKAEKKMNKEKKNKEKNEQSTDAPR